MAVPGPALNRLTFDNPWIIGVDAAIRRAPAWVVVAAVLAAAVAVGVLSRVLGGMIPQAVAELLPGPFGAQLGMALLYVLVFAPLWMTAGLGAMAERRVVWRSEPRPLLAGAGGLLLALAGLAVAVGIAAAAGAVRHGAEAGQGGGAGVGVLLGLAVFAYQAGGEEVLFRGWMQPVLGARLGPWLGLLATALAFGLLHLVGDRHTPLAMLNLVLAGLMFGLLALRSGGLWAAFCAHAAWNWAESCAAGLDPNPGVGAFGALTDLDLAGPPLWSGAGDALNGSLALTLVLTVIVATLAALPGRAR
jgi:membrane protease YdiL (CAAX protease family)